MTEPIEASSTQSPPPAVELRGVHLKRGKRSIFEGLDATFPKGQVTVLLGGSGAGKSTILRMVGGLVRPHGGRVSVAGQDITELRETDLYPVRDRIGMLFQGGALLDSMSVFDNVALPLREHTRASRDEIARRVREGLDAVALHDVEHLLPGQLSGGMNRRAALARAIVGKPEIVLCDEPFSGLDPVNVRRIERLIVELNQRLGLTFIVTSHHIPSALRMSHQLTFLYDRKAVSGPPKVLRFSADPTVREFFDAELGEADEAPGAHA